MGGRRDDILVREVDGEVVILDREAGQVHQLNPTGRYIWELLDDGYECDSIVDVMVQEFEVARETAEADVEGFLQQLRALGLVR